MIETTAMPPSDPAPLAGHQPSFSDAALVASKLFAALDRASFLVELLDAIGQSMDELRVPMR